MLLSVDPGRKPGYVLLDTAQLHPRRLKNHPIDAPAVIGAWRALPPQLGWTDVLVEAQWLFGSKNKIAILKLGPIAGWQLHAATQGGTAATPYMVLPADWRKGLGFGSNVPKEVVQNLVRAALLPAELEILAGVRRTHVPDCLDAIGQAWGWYATGPHTPWRIPP